ncbi:MAG TPA: hypothetical protein PKE47_08295, partial [Verrucomicrobiota bacterium]|nr:hypothetical protein [Verrucomicrobiota bacterium]
AGLQPEHQSGSYLRRHLLRVLPVRLRAMLDEGSGSMGQGGGGTNLFLVTVVARRAGLVTDPPEALVRDDAGREVLIRAGSALSTRADAVRIWTLPLVPHGSRHLEFRFLYDLPDGTRTNLPPVRLPNLLFSEVPAPAAEPLPAVRVVEGVGFQLLCADAAPDGWRFALRARHGGRPAPEWQVAGLQAVHPAAGPSRLWLEPAVPDGDGIAVQTYARPWPGDVHRLRFEFSRTNGFTEDELWRTPPLRLTSGGATGPGNSLSLSNPPPSLPAGTNPPPPLAETNLAGIRLLVHSLTAPRGVVPEPLTSSWLEWRESTDTHTLWVRLIPEPWEHRLTLVRAEDDAGRVIETQASGWTGGQYAWGLKPATNATAVRLTFALHRSRFAEFTVRAETNVAGHRP